ncbi:hypothetical protein ACU4GR_04225 [Methylobacterium oryzae CBMB20]
MAGAGARRRQLALQAVRRSICGDGATPATVVCAPAPVERARVTLATSRALPADRRAGTAKSRLSAFLSATGAEPDPFAQATLRVAAMRADPGPAEDRSRERARAVAPSAPLGQVAAASGAAIRRSARPGRFARSPDARTRRSSRPRGAPCPAARAGAVA